MSTTLEIKTSGMHCSSCSMLVTINLEDLDGVQAVECDHATGATSVTFDESTVGRDAILDTIREAGYDAELVKEETR